MRAALLGSRAAMPAMLMPLRSSSVACAAQASLIALVASRRVTVAGATGAASTRLRRAGNISSTSSSLCLLSCTGSLPGNSPASSLETWKAGPQRHAGRRQAAASIALICQAEAEAAAASGPHRHAGDSQDISEGELQGLSPGAHSLMQAGASPAFMRLHQKAGCRAAPAHRQLPGWR